MKPIQCIFALPMLIALVGCAGSCPRASLHQPAEMQPVERESVLRELETLQVTADQYRCQPMVSVVNHLRHLGKNPALDVLKTFYSMKRSHRSPESQLAVLSICRLLFQSPPEGWKEPWADYNTMGNHEYVWAIWEFKRELRAKFPLYPVAMSDGIPFFLTTDWNYGGGPGIPSLPDEATECLNACQKLEMMSTDLPEGNFDRAAIKLIKSAAFTTLFANTGANMSIVKLWFVMQAADPDRLFLRLGSGSE